MKVNGHQIFFEAKVNFAVRREEIFLLGQVLDEVGDRVEFRQHDAERAFVEDVNEALAEIAVGYRKVVVASERNRDSSDASARSGRIGNPEEPSSRRTCECRSD